MRFMLIISMFVLAGCSSSPDSFRRTQNIWTQTHMGENNIPEIKEGHRLVVGYIAPSFSKKEYTTNSSSIEYKSNRVICIKDSLGKEHCDYLRSYRVQNCLLCKKQESFNEEGYFIMSLPVGKSEITRTNLFYFEPRIGQVSYDSHYEGFYLNVSPDAPITNFGKLIYDYTPDKPNFKVVSYDPQDRKVLNFAISKDPALKNKKVAAGRNIIDYSKLVNKTDKKWVVGTSYIADLPQFEHAKNYVK